jgi:hypothetical protein
MSSDKHKPFAVRWAEHPIWEKIESFLDKAEGSTREERKARDMEALRASMDKERVHLLRGRTSFFDKPQRGTMEGFLSRQEIAFLSDEELLALDDRLVNEMWNETPHVTSQIVRKWADEITGGKLAERLEDEKECREEIEKDGGSDWLDSHLGNRGG